MSTKTKSSLRGIAYKRPRPKSKAEQLTARQNKLLTFNHPDYLELVNKRKIEIDGDGSVGGTLGKRKRGKKIAKKEVDELFKDLEGAEAIEAEELEDEDQQQIDEEAQKMDQSDRMSSADIGDEEDEDDQSPPEELFSLPKIPPQIEMNEEEEEHGGDRVSLSDKLEQIVHQKKPKLSKKKRDSLKKVQNGVYDVEMSGAKFKVMALSAKARVADEEVAAAYSNEWDEGTLMREPSRRGELQKPQTTFREQLLQMAGGGKERANRCSWKNRRWH